jgi:hypothetical protein
VAVRRVSDFEADRSIIEAALASFGPLPRWDRWVRAQTNNRVYVDDRGILVVFSVTPHPSIKIEAWLPMAVTDTTQFRRRLAALAFAAREVVTERPEVLGWRIWGFVPPDVAAAFRTRFGRRSGQFVVTVSSGEDGMNLPQIASATRASGLVSDVLFVAERDAL